MKITRILSLGVALSLFTACQSSEVVANQDCGEVKEFTVDEEYCNKYGLDPRNFTVKYPASLEMENQEDYSSTNYVSFVEADEDTNIIQAINLGYYYGLSESGGNGLFSGLLGTTKESLMEMLFNQLRQQGFNLEDVEMGDIELFGEEHFAARAKFNAVEETNGFLGSYIMQFVLYATSSDRGVMAIMSARDDSGITSFDEFETQGCLGVVIESL